MRTVVLVARSGRGEGDLVFSAPAQQVGVDELAAVPTTQRCRISVPAHAQGTAGRTGTLSSAYAASVTNVLVVPPLAPPEAAALADRGELGTHSDSACHSVRHLRDY